MTKFCLLDILSLLLRELQQLKKNRDSSISVILMEMIAWY